MNLKQIVQSAFLSGVIGCASVPDWEVRHRAEMNEIRGTIAFYNTNVEPLNVERDADAVRSSLQPRLDAILNYNLGICPLSDQERAQLANAFADLAVIYYNSQDFGSAKKYLEGAISVDGSNYRWHVNLGLVYYNMHNFVSAEAAFQRALNMHPNDEGIQQLIESVRNPQ